MNLPQEQELWSDILDAAQTRVVNCFSATFFQKRNISIIDQQSRCFNLCYALTRSRRVSRHTQVAIVGAGISGMTCAVALAMTANCLVYVFERDAMLLRRFRESAFRYFHPELNPTAGGRGKSFSSDPRLGTSFPFVNWSGGYGPELAEQLIRKFDHYRSVAGIALYLNEEIIEVASHAGRIRLRSKSEQCMCFDLAIVATGFGEERGSGLTNDESYWHSGNSREYRAIAVRRRHAPERVLISGNGDSAVVELAHYLIKDFRHHEIFKFLPHEIPPGRGQWYEAMQASLVHRRILSSIFYDEEAPDLPLATGVLGWYWTIRRNAERNPHLTLFEGQPPSAMEPCLYRLLHGKLHSYRNLNEVSSDVLLSLQKRASVRIEELASLELAEFARGLKVQKLVDPRISTIMRRDMRVTVVGTTPTIYSVRQAPLNWFLLAVLDRFSAFEYRRGRLMRRARVVRNEIHTQFGSFDRVIVRHGPKFDSLGYALTRAHDSVTAEFLHELFTHLVVDKTRTRLRDVFLEHFRSKHWRLARDRTQEFEDFRESENALMRLDTALRHADSYLLGLLGTPLERRAVGLYRRFKRATTAQGRAGVLAQFIRLTQQNVSRGPFGKTGEPRDTVR